MIYRDRLGFKNKNHPIDPSEGLYAVKNIWVQQKKEKKLLKKNSLLPSLSGPTSTRIVTMMCALVAVPLGGMTGKTCKVYYVRQKLQVMEKCLQCPALTV